MVLVLFYASLSLHVATKVHTHQINYTVNNVKIFFFKFVDTDVIEDIFKIGSMEPGAMLFEASKEFQVNKIFHF